MCSSGGGDGPAVERVGSAISSIRSAAGGNGVDDGKATHRVTSIQGFFWINSRCPRRAGIGISVSIVRPDQKLKISALPVTRGQAELQASGYVVPPIGSLGRGLIVLGGCTESVGGPVRWTAAAVQVSFLIWKIAVCRIRAISSWFPAFHREPSLTM